MKQHSLVWYIEFCAREREATAAKLAKAYTQWYTAKQTNPVWVEKRGEKPKSCKWNR